MGVLKNNGDENSFTIHGNGNGNLSSPVFEIPDTANTYVFSVNITGVSDCSTVGT